MNAIQLEFFRSEHECEISALRKRILKAEATLDKVRRGTYAKIGLYGKEIEELKQDMDIIKRGICKGDLVHENI